MMISKKQLASILLVAATSASNISAFAPQPQQQHQPQPPILLHRSPTPLSATRPIIDDNHHPDERPPSLAQSAKSLTLALLTSSLLLLSPLPSHADGQTKDFKLPPIDTSDKSRCTLSSSKMGQANAARDKLYDLRECDLRNANAAEYDLSGVIMTKTDVSGANFKEAQFSKGYLRDSNFEGADFTNAIVDRATFKGSSLKGAIFQNAVLTATSFEGADVEGADFTDAYIGDFDIRNLCRNPTLRGENPKTGADTRLSANCGPK